MFIRKFFFKIACCTVFKVIVIPIPDTISYEQKMLLFKRKVYDQTWEVYKFKRSLILTETEVTKKKSLDLTVLQY